MWLALELLTYLPCLQWYWSIGLLVDDAIVVVENVERIMEEDPHISVIDATTQSMGEISKIVIGIALILSRNLCDGLLWWFNRGNLSSVLYYSNYQYGVVSISGAYLYPCPMCDVAQET